MFGWVWLGLSLVSFVLFPRLILSKAFFPALLEAAIGNLIPAGLVMLGVWTNVLDRRWRLRWKNSRADRPQ